VIVPEIAYGALGVGEFALFTGVGGELDGPIAAAEVGDGIVIGIGAGEFVSGAVVEVQLQLALARIGNYNRTLSESDS